MTVATSLSNDNSINIDRRLCPRIGQVFGHALAHVPCMLRKNCKPQEQVERQEQPQQQQATTYIAIIPSQANKSSQDDDVHHDDSDSETTLTAVSSMDEEDDTASTTAAVTTVAGSPTKKSVRFDSVEIRHYGRTVDCHPCTQSGPALTLTWKVELKEEMKLGTFESIREQERNGYPRILGPGARQRLLTQDWNVSKYEIRNAKYISQLIQKQRRDTLQALRDAWYEQEEEAEEDWYNYSDSDDEDEELLWDRAQKQYSTASQGYRYAVDEEEENEPHLLAWEV